MQAPAVDGQQQLQSLKGRSAIAKALTPDIRTANLASLAWQPLQHKQQASACETGRESR